MDGMKDFGLRFWVLFLFVPGFISCVLLECDVS